MARTLPGFDALVETLDQLGDQTVLRIAAIDFEDCFLTLYMNADGSQILGAVRVRKRRAVGL